MELSFETKEKKAKAVADFMSLLTHPGWLLLESIVLANIEIVQEQILEGLGDKETLETINRLRDKLIVHKEIIGTPKAMIERLQSDEKVQENEDDPYS